MRRKPRQITTGRLQSLRLFSTLLAISLIDRVQGIFGGLADYAQLGWGSIKIRAVVPNVYEIEMVARSERT